MKLKLKLLNIKIMEKIHWRKNKDPKFLNGEDLKYNLANGVTDGMPVEISGVNTTESFDPNSQVKTQVAELRFKTLDGAPISKGIIPGKWAATFMKYNGIKSPFLNDWVGVKLIVYAQPDKRFGHVVRFKKYTPSFDDRPYLSALNNCKNMDELVKCYTNFDVKVKNMPSVIKVKNDLKTKYESN